MTRKSEQSYVIHWKAQKDTRISYSATLWRDSFIAKELSSVNIYAKYLTNINCIFRPSTQHEQKNTSFICSLLKRFLNLQFGLDYHTFLSLIWCQLTGSSILKRIRRFSAFLWPVAKSSPVPLPFQVINNQVAFNTATRGGGTRQCFDLMTYPKRWEYYSTNQQNFSRGGEGSGF